MKLEIEKRALIKETDKESKLRLKTLEKELAETRKKPRASKHAGKPKKILSAKFVN